jgi:hypothetical protein
MSIFDDLINIIFSKKKTFSINININSNKISEFIPKIYYIGIGKSGSTTIYKGFSNVNTVHWHNVPYFEKIYNTKLLTNNNYNLYDLIIYIGNKYNFKPIIIESIRNPISLKISSLFQHIKSNKEIKCNIVKCNKCQIKKMNNKNNIFKIIKEIIANDIKNSKEPYSIEMYKKYFNIDLLSEFNNNLNYYFNDTNNCYLLFLKFENIKDWDKIINNLLPYKFTLTHQNKTTNLLYDNIKNKIKFTKEELQILDNEIYMCFYTKNEIDKIRQKFMI